MDTRDLAEDFQNQFNDVVSRFQTKQFFQSDWDIVSFAVFFIFIGEWMEFYPKQYHICFPLRPSKMHHKHVSSHMTTILFLRGQVIKSSDLHLSIFI